MEFERARSVYERALEVDYRNQVSRVFAAVEFSAGLSWAPFLVNKLSRRP